MNLFAVRALDCLSPAGHASIQNVDRGFWSFAKILRRHIFPASPLEYADDSSCRHLIAFGAFGVAFLRSMLDEANGLTVLFMLLFVTVGDAPVGICRWRILPDAVDPTRTVVVIEHFGILEAKRKQGYGKQFLQQAIEVRTAVHCFMLHSYLSPVLAWRF